MARSGSGIAMSVRAIAGVATAALLGLAATALGQADITHADLSDTAVYGPVNGKYGYSWGSYTCNIGNQNLSWVSGLSPGLAMNAYRLHNGVLTQIGLGNAKTACCVGNGPGCGALTCSTSGTGLRAGCRDYYSAGFNAGQGHLGPRSGINAWTGAFAAIPAGSGDAIWRRCQVAASDMSATNFPGALYFAEGEYVCTEEPPAQKLNNCTYRRCTINPTTFAWTVQGTSQTGVPAIYAWRDHGLGVGIPDPSVVITTVDVPSEGRFIFAGKATNLNNGTWRYDYAVFNLDSDRSGGQLQIPVPGTATVTDTGFSAPQYHSGEPFSNTPWGTSRNSAGVIFSTDKYGTNPNAAALRWGTMYNFWFTTNVAPSMPMPGGAGGGTLTLDLFKPGPSGSVNSITAGGLPVPTPPACTADFDGSGALAVADIFAFLDAWFAHDPRSDFNGANGITEQDTFDFLNAWFNGC